MNETKPASAGAAGPGDAEIVAELDISEAKADSWRRLLALAEDFAALPHHKQDSTVVSSVDGPNGTFTMGYVAYGPRITGAISLLYAVGAVSPSFPWTQVPAPQVPNDGTLLSVSSAVRLATALVRADRFVEGHLGEAAERGELQAVLSALAAWYRRTTTGT